MNLDAAQMNAGEGFNAGPDFVRQARGPMARGVCRGCVCYCPAAVLNGPMLRRLSQKLADRSITERVLKLDEIASSQRTRLKHGPLNDSGWMGLPLHVSI